MNKLRKEIEELFAVKSGNGAYPLKNENTKDSWVIRNGSEYGVFIKYDGDMISEEFSNVALKTDVKILDGEKLNVLQITCLQSELRNKFSVICEEFTDCGEKGEKRAELLSNPLEWWMRWKELLGNIQGNKKVYDVVGELSALEKLCSLGETPVWSATKRNSHDIETLGKLFEVKSTLNKNKSIIHISSQFQLSASKPLFLIFTRLEESAAGKSIDDLMEELKKYQPEMLTEYSNYLDRIGLATGSHYRKISYEVLERRKYMIGEKFPKITEETFSNNKIPDNILHIEYDVDLEGLQYENWK